MNLNLNYDAHIAYAAKHCCCPRCKSGNLMTTTKGCIMRGDESDRDTNRATCLDCEWKGIVHDLVGKSQ